MTDKERKDTQKAILYDLRLIVKASEKAEYPKEELLGLFDAIATGKDRES